MSVSFALPRDLSAAREAREFTRDSLAAWRIPAGDFADTLVLCVWEAVANAVTHGAGRPVLTLDFTGGAVLVSVHDDGGPVILRQRGDEHGRGLTLITALAGKIDVTPCPLGKDVSFLLPLPVLSAAAA